MTSGINVDITYDESNDKNKKSDVDSETSAKKPATKKKTPEPLTEQQLARVKEIQAKYLDGSATGPEIKEFLALTKTQIRTGLRDLLTKKNTLVGGEQIIRGKPLSQIVERRGHPNEKKNRLKKQITAAMSRASDKLMQQSVLGQQPSALSQEMSKPTPESSSKDVDKSALESSSKDVDKPTQVQHNTNLKNVYGFGFGNEGLPDPASVTREEWLKEYMPLIMKGVPDAKLDHEDFVNLESMFGNKNPFSPDSPLMKTLSKWVYNSDLHYVNWYEGVSNLFKDKSDAAKMMLEQISKETDTVLNQEEFGDPGDLKPLAESFVKYLPKYLASKPNSDISNLLETSKAVLDPLEYAISTWEKFQIKKSPEQSASKTIDSQSVVPPTKKQENIFDYSKEENATKYEEEKSKRKQEQASKKKQANEEAKKMVSNAILPVNDALKDIAYGISKIGTGSGGGGKGKGPKAPAGFEGENFDDEDMGKEDDPFPVLRARIENVTRSFESSLYGEKESNLFSSLQKTFDKGRRSENLDIVQQNIEEEVRAQMKLLLAFETRNENARNSLEAILIEKIRKEVNKPEENQSIENNNWLRDRLKEVSDSRNKIEDEFAKIEADITSKLSERATAGFVQGKIERDIRQMEVQGKEEDKIIDTYMKQFGKYVKSTYKQIAEEQAFEVGIQTMEANKDTMRSTELLKKVKIAYDKEFTRVMNSVPTETELTRDEILEAHQAGQGKFLPESFRAKGASPQYNAKLASNAGGMGGGGGNTGVSSAASEGPDDIPPKRENLSLLLPSSKVDMDKVRQNFARWALIQQATGPMVQASTPKGTQGSQVFGNAATVGGGALALGIIGGPLATVAVGITQMTGILAEIAENTSEEVAGFSPEVVLAKVEQTLNRLSVNMSLANQYGKDLANYQKSSSAMSNQLYQLGVDIWGVIDGLAIFLIDILTFVVAMIRMSVLILSTIWSLLEIILWPLYALAKQLVLGSQMLMNLLTGWSKGSGVKNYTEDFMSNDPRNKNNP